MSKPQNVVNLVMPLGESGGVVIRRHEFATLADAEAFAEAESSAVGQAEALALVGLAVVAAWTAGNLGMAVTELANVLREQGYDVPN